MKIENVEITKIELAPFLTSKKPNLQEKVDALLEHQMTPVAGFTTYMENMKKYRESHFSKIRINGIEFCVFYNPTRKKNVKANTFTDSHEKFDCFLCELLPGQRGVKSNDGNYMIIVNPGITIYGDLTIPTIQHVSQLLEPHFADMLTLARDLPQYSIYFNGPMAGATCPHFHFQAGKKDRLPAEKSINKILQNTFSEKVSKYILFKNEETEIAKIKNFIRTTYYCYSDSVECVIKFALKMMHSLKDIDKKYIKNLPNIPDFESYIQVFNDMETEARFNIMTKYYPETKKYLTVFFPKLFNRPQSYFDNNLILGFAIKEALGHVLTANKNDLYKILNDTSLLKQAYLDTNITDEMDCELLEKLVKYYK